MSQPNFNRDLELVKVNILFEESRGRYQTLVGFYSTGMVAILAVALTAFIGLALTRDIGNILLGLALFVADVLVVIVYVLPLFKGADRAYKKRLGEVNSLIRTIQTGKPIPDLDELLKQSNGPDERSKEEDTSGKSSSPTRVETSESLPEADLPKLIEMVDEQFKNPGIVNRFRILLSGYMLIVLGLMLMLVAAYFALLFSFSGQAISLDSLLLGITLAVVTMSLGVSLAYTFDEAERFRHIEGRRHLAALKDKANDESALLLGALVRMRVSLPPGSTLKEVYQRDKSAFTMERLMIRALDSRLV